MAMQTPENAIMNREDIILVDGPEQLSQETDLTIEEAIALTDVIETRAGNRSDGRKDLIIEIEDWMASFWEDDYGVKLETSFLLCGEVADYSEKAWKLYGCYLVNKDGLELESSITSAVQVIDHSTTEYPKEKGETYLAKSGTVQIFALE